MSSDNEQAKKSSLRSYLGKMRRRLATNTLRTNGQLRRYAQSVDLTHRQLALLASVNPRIDKNDEMYSGDGGHYFMAGLSAITCIEAIMETIGKTDVGSILDMPCGHGRELRILKARFPAARLMACDIQNKAVDFCAKTFKVSAFYSRPELGEINFPDKFDLIWCGSLVTHLNRTAIIELIKLFSRSLNPGGLAVYTAHGDFVAGDMAAGSSIYMIPSEDVPKMTADYGENGYAYHDYTHDSNYFDFYPDQSGYGISLTSAAWMREQLKKIPDLKEIYFKERGWSGHQDVYGLVKLCQN